MAVRVDGDSSRHGEQAEVDHANGRLSEPSSSGTLICMSDPYFQSLFAERIGGANYGKGTEIYKFEKIKRAKRKALADHPERKLLDFGIGENDEMAAGERPPS